jgi:hypothetical protein
VRGVRTRERYQRCKTSESNGMFTTMWVGVRRAKARSLAQTCQAGASIAMVSRMNAVSRARSTAWWAVRGWVVAGVLVVATGCGRKGAETERAGPEIWVLERARHPRAGAQDYYKAAFQACLGPEHDLGDRATARRRLDDELATLGPPAANEVLLEPLPAVGAPEPMARVNLRPLRARGVAADALLDAMGAAGAAGAAGAYRAAGRACLARTWRGVLTVLGAEGRELDAALAARGYPAVHHTAAYRAAYAPAYRVAPIAHLRRAGIE